MKLVLALAAFYKPSSIQQHSSTGRKFSAINTNFNSPANAINSQLSNQQMPTNSTNTHLNITQNTALRQSNSLNRNL